MALGDSYTAGTGAGAEERPAGLSCWESHPGYVDLVAKTGRVDLVGNAACHGAVLSTASPTYDSVIHTPTVREQLLGLVGEGKLGPDTELVSITAGANDLGFSGVLGVCALYGETACQAAVAQATSPAALASLTAGLVQTYSAIHQAAPNARIVVLGYPMLFDPSSSFAPIPVANQVLINGATLAVNATISGAVATANGLYGTNARYVDVVSRFAGHAANSLDPWLQLDPNNFAADYNFHPNAAGHRAYASAVMGSISSAQPSVR
ncbi:lysophospholipase L1-like esterase [Pseudarthrobacter defluvii]|uniref:SGNH/GDSL hydrolase family protein n=1 Tax=Pseudarthrobacter defluvii TaxID=410837 RepID=UPI002786A74D|nr:SGNH/GDSL hydrolase family protein [Pseudarthrobacter defluvii]MDQ0767830.1 lysophospholipase L1-like esterase [Pseudarthrobacter defluvii]